LAGFALANVKSRLLSEGEDSSDIERFESINVPGSLCSNAFIGRLQQEGRQSNATYTAANTTRTYSNSCRQPKCNSTGPNNNVIVANHKFH
jgi:hypothetical protein